MNNKNFKQVINAVLNIRGMKAAELADAIETSRSNLSSRMSNGSFTMDMLEKMSAVLKADIIYHAENWTGSLTKSEIRYQPHTPATSLASESANPYPKKIVIELDPEEAKEIIIKQTQTIDEMRKQLEQLQRTFSEYLSSHGQDKK